MRRTTQLCLLLLILIATSQLRWLQKLAGRREFQGLNQISDVEADLEDSIVLMQEKNIHKLKELVQDLKEQLQQCWSSKNGDTIYSVWKNNSKFAPT